MGGFSTSATVISSGLYTQTLDFIRARNMDRTVQNLPQRGRNMDRMVLKIPQRGRNMDRMVLKISIKVEVWRVWFI